MQDGLHPNVQGYQSILEDILNWSPLTSFVGVDGFIQPFTGIAEKWCPLLSVDLAVLQKP